MTTGTPTGTKATVRAVMSELVARVAPEASLQEVARKLAAVEAGALVVGGVDRIDGIIGERDLVRALAAKADPTVLTAKDMQSTELLWVEPGCTVAEAGRRMGERHVRHALVGRAPELLGIVSARDLLEALCS